MTSKTEVYSLKCQEFSTATQGFFFAHAGDLRTFEKIGKLRNQFSILVCSITL